MKKEEEATENAQRMGLCKSTLKVFIVIMLVVSWAGIVLAQIPEIIGWVQADKDDTFFGWQIVPLGDQNGDNYADFLVLEAIRLRSYVYYRGPTINQAPVLVFDSVSGRISNVGDINGDSVNDIAMFRLDGVDGQLNLYFGGPSMDTVADGWLGVDSSGGMGYTLDGNDLNFNGTPEFISWQMGQRNLALFELDTLYKSAPNLVFRPPVPNDSPAYVMGDGMVVGDFNGDDTLDLVANLRPAPSYMKNGKVLFYWGGVGFDTIPDFSITRFGPDQQSFHDFGWELENLGDISGDGFSDLLAAHRPSSADTISFIYFGGPGIDTIPDVTLPDHSYFAAPAGDINDDGHPDLLTSLWVQFRNIDFSNVYFGGPNMDSLWDIRIKCADLPIFMVSWGMDVAGLGDVNGDVIDDFAVSGEKFGDTGMVFIFAGDGIGTAVEPRPDTPVPTRFTLAQNYPNPFNAVTTIAFDIPTRSHIEIKVYNIMGRTVRTLVSQELAAGAYSVVWDATTDSGSAVASGTYFCTLRSGGTSETRQMHLVK